MTALTLMLILLSVHEAIAAGEDDQCKRYLSKNMLGFDNKGNLALGKQAKQSPTYPGNAHPASMAFDGKLETLANTEIAKTSWIEVDLAGNYSIGMIKLYLWPKNYKLDRLQFLVDDQLCFEWQEKLSSEILEIQCDKAMMGSRVRLEVKGNNKTGHNYVSVCEFQVYEKRVDRMERLLSFCTEQMKIFASHAQSGNLTKHINEKCLLLATQCPKLHPTTSKPFVSAIETRDTGIQCFGFCSAVLENVCVVEKKIDFCSDVCKLFPTRRDSTPFDTDDDYLKQYTVTTCTEEFMSKGLTGVCVEFISFLLSHKSGLQAVRQCSTLSQCAATTDLATLKVRLLQIKSVEYNYSMCTGFFKGAQLQTSCKISKQVHEQQKQFCQELFGNSTDDDIIEECLAFEIGQNILKGSSEPYMYECKKKHPAEYEKYKNKFNFAQARKDAEAEEEENSSSGKMSYEMKRDLVVIGSIFGFIAVMLVCFGVYKVWSERQNRTLQLLQNVNNTSAGNNANDQSSDSNSCSDREGEGEYVETTVITKTVKRAPKIGIDADFEANEEANRESSLKGANTPKKTNTTSPENIATCSYPCQTQEQPALPEVVM